MRIATWLAPGAIDNPKRFFGSLWLNFTQLSGPLMGRMQATKPKLDVRPHSPILARQHSSPDKTTSNTSTSLFHAPTVRDGVSAAT